VAAILLIFHFYLHKREALLRREAQGGAGPRSPPERPSYCKYVAEVGVWWWLPPSPLQTSLGSSSFGKSFSWHQLSNRKDDAVR